MTLLPSAHPFAPAAEGRRCAACRNVKRHGLHRGTTLACSPVQPVGYARRSVYRTSGTPHLARTGMWAALAAREPRA